MLLALSFQLPCSKTRGAPATGAMKTWVIFISGFFIAYKNLKPA